MTYEFLVSAKFAKTIKIEASNLDEAFEKAGIESYDVEFNPEDECTYGQREYELVRHE